MNTKDLKEYIEFMNANDLCEIEVENDGKKIRLKKNSAAHAVIPQVVAPAVHHLAAGAAKSASSVPAGSIEIKSPMVGTFYRSASPGAKPYIEVGDTVKPGDVLCIVEAMKLMNEIKAEVAGKVIQIPVENSAPVEFGQALFIVEPL